MGDENVCCKDVAGCFKGGCGRLCCDAGTLAYMAPECFDSRVGKLTDKADIFSFGVLVWEMVVGKPPWQVRVGFMLCSWAVPGGENRVASSRVDVMGMFQLKLHCEGAHAGMCFFMYTRLLLAPCSDVFTCMLVHHASWLW